LPSLADYLKLAGGTMTGELEVASELNVRCAVALFKKAIVYAVKSDDTKINLMEYSEVTNSILLGKSGLDISVIGNWASDILMKAGKGIRIADFAGGGNRAVMANNDGDLYV